MRRARHLLRDLGLAPRALLRELVRLALLDLHRLLLFGFLLRALASFGLFSLLLLLARLLHSTQLGLHGRARATTLAGGSIGIVAGVGDGEAAGELGDEYGEELGDGEYGELWAGDVGDVERGVAGGGEYGELGDGEYGDGAPLGEDVGVIGEEAGRSAAAPALASRTPDATATASSSDRWAAARRRGDGIGDLLDPEACGAGAGALLLSPPAGF